MKNYRIAFKEFARFRNTFLFLSLLIIFFTISIISFSPENFIYDETHYFSNTKILIDSTDGWIFLNNMKGPVGPLTNFIQFFIGGIFNYEEKYLRFINLGLIIMTSTIAGIYFYRTKLNKSLLNSIAIPLTVCFSFPFTWIVAGMALTESASIFFSMMSLLLAGIYFKKKNKNYFLLFLSALSSSISATGRQTLIVLAPLIFLFTFLSKKIINLKEAMLYFIVTLILPLILFVIWGGIIPQDYHVELFAKTGFLSLSSLLLSIGYLGFGFLFICPSLILRNILSLRGIYSLIASIFLNIFLQNKVFPLKSVINKFFINSSFYNTFETLFPILGTFVGFILIIIMLDRIRSSEIDNLEYLSWIMLFLINFSNVAITHQFSSRYVAVSLAPLIVIGTFLTNPILKIDRLANIIGIFLGALSLISYYKFYSPI